MKKLVTIVLILFFLNNIEAHANETLTCQKQDVGVVIDISYESSEVDVSKESFFFTIKVRNAEEEVTITGTARSGNNDISDLKLDGEDSVYIGSGDSTEKTIKVTQNGGFSQGDVYTIKIDYLVETDAGFCSFVVTASGSGETADDSAQYICKFDDGDKTYSEAEFLDIYVERYGCEDISTIECTTGTQCFGENTSGPSFFCCKAAEDQPVNPKDSFKEDACDELEGEEKINCEACIFTEGKSDLTGAIWTELGCIDPSPAGLITRIFQIGLGIMSGIGVLRFGQIALLYQSKDQEKIKEAGGMMVSLMGGLVMLIAGIILLEFLGINILGLPDDFLG